MGDNHILGDPVQRDTQGHICTSLPWNMYQLRHPVTHLWRDTLPLVRRDSRQDTSLAAHSVPHPDTRTRGDTWDILHKTVVGKFGQCPNI